MSAQYGFVQVEIEDIKRVYTLFVDVKRSTQFLMEYQKVMLTYDAVRVAVPYGVPEGIWYGLPVIP